MKNISLTIGSAVIVGFMSYLYSDYKSEQTEKVAELALISSEVSNHMEDLKQLNCLSLNIYHEARSEGLTGQRAIAWVTLNRVKSPKYPDTVCEVVYQAELNENGIPLLNRCQFSWFCDGRSDKIRDQTAWNISQEIAQDVYSSYGKETDPTNGSVMYHAHYVVPYWASSYDKQARIDSHIFYN